MSDLKREPRGAQKEAVEARGRDVVVTAGAGTGKTFTLVARYLSLLADGHSPRQLLAITFTEKAGREMRNRVRAAAQARAREARDREERRFWAEIEAGMDAARISTIHAFCAELLRAHPAQAGVDPEFQVAEEGLAALLKREAVGRALAWAVEQPQLAPLFRSFSAPELERLLASLLERRLDAAEILAQKDAPVRWRKALRRVLQDFSSSPQVSGPLMIIQLLADQGRLVEDAGEKLAGQLAGLLDCWQAFRSALARGALFQALAHLHAMRRQYMGLRAGKRTSRAKDMLRDLRQAYQEWVEPWLGGAKASDTPPDPPAEERYAQDLERLAQLFGAAQQAYLQALRERQALDFDDLEAGALRLLGDPAIRRKWQAELRAILVDEFQDTNARQRDIVWALSGQEAGRLFIVGDARQSIYRFRGADVTVFRQMGREIKGRGGLALELELTYRSHPELLRILDALLPPVMGGQEAPDRPYHVPYTAMKADRAGPRANVRPPYMELLLGSGEGAEDGREQAARALAQRLLKLRDEGQIQRWDEVALLFRASTGFAPYEDALEAAGVPFVTVAGRGFYDRPEIRDLLNILQALADPYDDLALAGLLRSPAFALTDAALYQLRWQGQAKQPLHAALDGDLAHLEAADRERALRARAFLAQMRPLVGRLAVAELLKRAMDATNYRAALASAHRRYWQNVDKLLADAHTSQLVGVRAFLEYIRTLRDVGAREGEAPVEAQGAVQLMTVHKAKGLEFPFVIIADAFRQVGAGGERFYLLPETGLAFKPDRLQAAPLAYRLAKWLDGQRAQAEENRLLYVAATRAREKLMVSGHCSLASQAPRTGGWMQALLEAAGIDVRDLLEERGRWRRVELENGAVVGACLWDERVQASPRRPSVEQTKWPHSQARPLFKPLVLKPAERLDAGLDEEPRRDWRATGARLHPPAAVVGLMVHKALERWLFPGDEGCQALLESVALAEGLVDPAQRRRAVRGAEKLLGRFAAHPLRQEIEQAPERHHELPYTYSTPSGLADSGVIDLLYRLEGGWKLVDFKADELRDEAGLGAAVDEYGPQMRRYRQATRALLGVDPTAVLCFLDCMGEVRVVTVPGD
jgi:ATP-dependent helicase/nuclease subunit A